VDAFRSREQALLAQIETQKAAFDAREAALRFQPVWKTTTGSGRPKQP